MNHTSVLTPHSVTGGRAINTEKIYNTLVKNLHQSFYFLVYVDLHKAFISLFSFCNAQENFIKDV